MTVLLEDLDLHECYMLKVAIAARDYPSSYLMWNSGGPLLLQWAADAKSILVLHPSSTTIQLGEDYNLIHLAAKTIITRL